MESKQLARSVRTNSSGRLHVEKMGKQEYCSLKSTLHKVNVISGCALIECHKGRRIGAQQLPPVPFLARSVHMQMLAQKPSGQVWEDVLTSPPPQALWPSLSAQKPSHVCRPHQTQSKCYQLSLVCCSVCSIQMYVYVVIFIHICVCICFCFICMHMYVILCVWGCVLAGICAYVVLWLCDCCECTHVSGR